MDKKELKQKIRNNILDAIGDISRAKELIRSVGDKAGENRMDKIEDNLWDEISKFWHVNL